MVESLGYRGGGHLPTIHDIGLEGRGQSVLVPAGGPGASLGEAERLATEGEEVLELGVESLVSQSSPLPTTAPATSFLRLDHLVDLLLERADADELVDLDVACVWPIRKARSVAWFSTAGFHQRSKWKTWLAAVRFRPVPAGLDRQQEDAAGPSPLARLEPLDHPVALRLGDAAVEEEDLAAERLLEVPAEDRRPSR